MRPDPGTGSTETATSTRTARLARNQARLDGVGAAIRASLHIADAVDPDGRRLLGVGNQNALLNRAIVIGDV